MKLDLYIDFDGVILNTIELTYAMIDEMGLKSSEEILSFYRELDWDNLFENCSPINNSLENIRKLIDSNLYNVSILSHVCCENESISKKKFLKEHFDDLKVITLDCKIRKCDVVHAKNAILVDDYMGNLDAWASCGGIPVKFSDNGNKYDYITVSSLDMLIDKYDEIRKKIEN